MTQASPATILPPIKPYHPTTFLERGAVVPFTTPLLVGTRARPADKQSLELIIPNPSGTRGAYIMAWTGITSFCSPTLHDRVFNERIAELDSVTPTTIRRVARAVAAEGLAGEEAREAAQQAVSSDQEDQVVMNYRLLMALVKQVSQAFPDWSGVQGSDELGPEEQARHTVDWISPRLGRPRDWTAAALEDLADVMASMGDGSAGPTGRVPRLVSMLRKARRDIANWGKTLTTETEIACVEMVCVTTDFTVSLVDSMLAKALALTGDVIKLLQTWSTDPNTVTKIVTRPDWLLDGWEQICQVWNHAGNEADRRMALAEITGLVPIIPKEASDWSDSLSDANASLHLRRLIPLNEDWRTGTSMVFKQIARNEHFRATAC